MSLRLRQIGRTSKSYRDQTYHVVLGFFQKKKKTVQLPIRSNSDDDLVFDNEPQPRVINVIRRDFTTKKEVSYRYQMVQDYIQLRSK